MDLFSILGLTIGIIGWILFGVVTNRLRRLQKKEKFYIRIARQQTDSLMSTLDAVKHLLIKHNIHDAEFFKELEKALRMNPEVEIHVKK